MRSKDILGGFVYIGEGEPGDSHDPNRDWLRQHVLPVKGKRTLVNKRPRPDNLCELCGKLTPTLYYHHWDDLHPSLGIWVCGHCHKMVAGKCKVVDENIMDKYIRLKKLLEDKSG